MPKNKNKNKDFVAKVFIDLDEYQTLIQCKRQYLELINKEDKKEEKESEDETSSCQTNEKNQFGEGFYESGSDESNDDSQKTDSQKISEIQLLSENSKEEQVSTLPIESKVLLTHLPLSFRAKARVLLVKLLANVNFSYNSETLEISLYNNVIHGSNIAKLLQSCFETKIRKRPLKGNQDFILFLKNENLENFIPNGNKAEKTKANIATEKLMSVQEPNVNEIKTAAENFGSALPWYYIG